MIRLLAGLFLCFNSVLSFAIDPSAAQPWMANAPRQEQKNWNFNTGGEGAIRGFGDIAGSPAKKSWIEDAKRNYSKTTTESSEKNAPSYDMQVFISSGMPEGVLRQLFRQALADNPAKIRFVVRGFKPQKLGELMSKFRSLLPDPLHDDLIVEIDPNAFRNYHVDAVPVYLVQDAGKWFEIKGAASIEAVRALAKKKGSYTSGEVYAIAEPDILSIIEDRARNYDWKPVINRARSRIAQNMKPGFDLPTASNDAVSYYVPMFVVPNDIMSPGKDGKGETVIAKAGQKFALLDYTSLQVPVIVFDVTDKRQWMMAQKWLKEPQYKNADVFIVGSTVEPRSPVSLVTTDVARVLGHHVYPLMQRLGERFGLEAVPAIVEQEGRRLKIQYFDPKKAGL